MSTTDIIEPRVGDTFLVMADLITFKVCTSESGGRLAVVEVLVPPGGGPPPLHIHPPDEVFHVVTGEVTVFHGQPESADRVTLGPGQTDHVPGGVPHTFRNFTDEAAVLLLTFCPGEMMTRFFVEAGHRSEDRAQLPELDLAAEVPRVFGVGQRLGMQLLSPPESRQPTGGAALTVTRSVVCS
jgi:mannose-6-phosphate isomerase-like protein (cupin superfamily)